MWELFVPFALFVMAMTGTPGPGNMAMLLIGQTTGFRSALPFLLGTTIGAVCLNTLVACGLGEAFLHWPGLMDVLRVLGTIYICYLAWKILRLQARPAGEGRRFTLAEGLLIHPLSPKSWAMSVAAYTQFFAPLALEHGQVGLAPTLLFLLTFMAGQVGFHSLWCLLGAGLARLLEREAVRWAVNGTLVALMLGATAYAMVGG